MAHREPQHTGHSMLQGTLIHAKLFGQYSDPQNQWNALKAHPRSKRSVTAESRLSPTVRLQSGERLQSSGGKRPSEAHPLLSPRRAIGQRQGQTCPPGPYQLRQELQLLFFLAVILSGICANPREEGEPATSYSLRFTPVSPDVSLPVRQRKEASLTLYALGAHE